MTARMLSGHNVHVLSEIGALLAGVGHRLGNDRA